MRNVSGPYEDQNNKTEVSSVGISSNLFGAKICSKLYSKIDISNH